MNNYKKRAGINLLISYSAIVIGFFNTIYRTQILTAEQIGLIAILFSIAGILMFFVQSAFTNVIIKYVNVFKDISKKKGLIIFILIIAFGLFLLFSAIFLFTKNTILTQYNNKLLNEYINYVIVILFIQSFFNLLDVALRSFSHPNFSTFLKYIVQGLLHTILLFSMIILGFEFQMYFLILISISIVNLLILMVYFNKKIGITNIDFSFINFKLLKEMLVYGLFMSFGGFVSIIANRIDKIMLGIYAGLALTGIYTIAIIFGNILGRIGEAIIKIYHPKVSQDLNDGNYDEIKQDYKEVGKFQLFLGMFIFTFFYFYSKNILASLDSKYAQGYWVIIIMAFGQLVNNATSICGGIISYSKYYKFDFVIKLFLLIINIILNFLLIPRFGIIGAVIATSSALTLYNLGKLIYVYQKYKFHPFSKYTIKIIYSNIIIAGSFLLIQKYYEPSNLLYIILIGLTSFIAYNFLLFMISFFTREEINMIKRRFVK